MATFTGDKEWHLEYVEPNDDAPLMGIWVQAWRDGSVVEDGPSWRFGTEEQEEAARIEAEAMVERRNAEEAKVAAAASPNGKH